MDGLYGPLCPIMYIIAITQTTNSLWTGILTLSLLDALRCCSWGFAFGERYHAQQLSMFWAKYHHGSQLVSGSLRPPRCQGKSLPCPWRHRILIHRHLTAGKPQPAATYPVLPGLDGAGCCQRYDASEGGTFQITAMKKAWLRFFSCRCNQNHLKDWSYCRVSQNSEPLMAWEAWVVPVVFNFDFESLPRWELHNLSVGMLREKNWIRRNCWGDIFLST